jgi:serine/threonine-protein kinase
MEPSVPKKVGRYTVDRLLGTGAMGTVFLGRDPELDRPVAIKTLREMGLDRDALDRFLERFRNEARAAARLHHPSIVQIYDVGEDPDTGPFLVFEYVAGSTLKQMLRDRGALDPATVVGLAEQIADALDAAHDRGIIHRDLKPENLLVTPEGTTKLADFGVARVPNAALTREGQFLGTPCYSAPETLRSGRYGPRTDLFSFAAVLYEAVSGARAFPGDDAVAVASKVIHDEPAAPSVAARGQRVPSAVDEEIRRGLSKDPEARHDSAMELASALRAAYEDAGLVAPEEVPRRAESRRFRTSQAPARAGGFAWAFAAVLAGGLALGVGAVLWLGESTEGGAAAQRPSGSPDKESAGEATSLEPAGAGGPERDEPPAAETAADASAFVLRSGSVPEPEAAEDRATRMSPHDREEAAKDALARARDHIAGERWEAARHALAEARRYDPENPDVERLRSQLPGE